MKPLIVYHMLDYVKSLRFVPPVSTYIIALIVNYTYQPNPVLSSYAITSMYLFFITAWLTIGFFHTEDPIQQNLTILHAKSETKYFLSKYFTVCLVILILSLVSVVYPIVFGMFGKPVSFLEWSIGFLNHFLLGILSVSIAVLFTRNVVKKSSTAWLGVSLALVISLISTGLKQDLPGFMQKIVLVLPPVPQVFSLIEREHIQEMVPEIFFVYGWVCMYAFVLFVLFLSIIKRRGRELF